MSVSVVWVPMLGSDDEPAARQSSAIFNDPRVQQYWDPNRLSGKTYSRDVFPTMLKDMAAALPDDHMIKESIQSRANLQPEKAPLWDVVFFYNPGATWTKQPPTPTRWTKQILYYGKQPDKTSGEFFRDHYTKPPTASDWFEELSEIMSEIITGIPKRN